MNRCAFVHEPCPDTTGKSDAIHAAVVKGSDVFQHPQLCGLKH